MTDERSADPNRRDLATRVKIVWGLYAAAILWFVFPLPFIVTPVLDFVITPIVGLALAYVWRDGASTGGLFRDHFEGQIRLFWVCLIFFIIAELFYRLFEDYILATLTCLYLVVMSVIGLAKIFDNKPYKKSAQTLRG